MHYIILTSILNNYYLKTTHIFKIQITAIIYCLDSNVLFKRKVVYTL